MAALQKADSKEEIKTPVTPSNDHGSTYFVLKLEDLSKRPQAISCHAWNKDGTMLAFSPMNHEIHILQFTEGAFSTLEILRSHEQKVTGIDWAPESNQIVSCSEDRNAYVWNYEGDGWKPTLVILQFQRSAVYVKWSHNEKKFAVASSAKCVAICYYEEEHKWWVSKIIEGFNSSVLTLAWHQSDCFIAAGSSDCTVQFFSSAYKGVDKKPPPLFGSEVSLAKVGTKICELKMSSWVIDVAFSPDGGVIAMVTHDSSIHFISIAVSGRSDLLLPSKDRIQTIRLSSLPHRRVLFASNDSVIAGGHDCNPALYVCKDGVWAEMSKLDDASGSKKPGGSEQTSARNAAFRKFEMASPIGEGNGGSELLQTRHQNCITGLSTCVAWGAPRQTTQLSSVGLDGRLCMWMIPSA